MIRPQFRIAATVGVAVAALAAQLGAQNAQNNVVQQGWNPQQILRTETFVKPPADVEKMIMTPRTDISFTNPSPDRKWFLRAPAADRGDIDAYGKAHINLGGLQIDTKANRARTVTTSTRYGLTLIDPRTMATKTIETPKGATLWAQTWSPTGTQIAYIANFDDASHDLRRRCRDREVRADHEDAAQRDARHEPRLDSGRQEHRHRARPRRPRRGADSRQGERRRGRTGSPAHRIARAAAGDPSEPARGSARQGAAHLLHDRSARDHRREVEGRSQDRSADDDSRGRCVARRSVLPRHAHGRAVLLHRARGAVRFRAGVVGRDRQGRRDVEQDAAARGRSWRR